MHQHSVNLRKLYITPEPEELLEVRCSDVYELPAKWWSHTAERVNDFDTSGSGI